MQRESDKLGPSAAKVNTQLLPRINSILYSVHTVAIHISVSDSKGVWIMQGECVKVTLAKNEENLED